MNASANKMSDITQTGQIISSCSGAVLTALIMTPLDVVKIRMQAQLKPFKKGSCFIYSNGLMDHLCICNFCNGNRAEISSNVGASSSSSAMSKDWYRRPGAFNGTIDALVKIARNEGVLSLWSGLPPTLVMALPSTVIYFTLYDYLKYKVGFREGDPATKYIPLVMAPSARLVAVSLISPLELVRTKLQTETMSYNEVLSALRRDIRSTGWRTLTLGLGPSLLRDMPFSAIYWFCYESMKSRFLGPQPISRELAPLPAFCSGAVAGSVAAIVTLPFDVIKTQRQMTLGSQELQLSDAVKRIPTSTWKLIYTLYSERGFRVLFTGLVPRITKVAPSCAIMISSYEYGKHFFRTHHGAVSFDT